MRAIAQTTLLSCVSLALIPLGASIRVVPEAHSLVKDPQKVLKAKNVAALKYQAIHLLHEDASHKISTLWSHPVLLAILLGLLLIGPAQLGSLMTMCALTSGFTSFKVGFSWGLGHSMGMLAICPVFFLMRGVSGNLEALTLAKWEHCGNYFVGVSLIVLAVDFLIHERWYRRQIEEASGEAFKIGAYFPAGECDLAQAGEEPQDEPSSDSLQKDLIRDLAEPAQSVQQPERDLITDQVAPELSMQQFEADLIRDLGLDTVKQCLEKTKFLPKSEEEEVTWSSMFCPSFLSARHYQAAVVGIFQGLCCPMAITGVLLMDRTIEGSSPLMRSIFASTFVLVSSIGAGMMALGWGSLSTWTCSPRFVLPRTVYWFGCIVTLLLGLCCIVANASGALHSNDWEAEANALAAGTNFTGIQ